MKRIVFILFSLLCFKSNAQDAKQIAKEALNFTLSVVALDKISQPLAYGSGFVIEGGYIVTNVHVIEGSSSVYVLKNNSEEKYKIDGYVAIDKINDLVILKAQNFYCSSIGLADTTLPEIGERIYAIGNPKGLSGTFSEGIVSGLRNLGANQVIQITAPISPGSSGGPVLNNQAEVIGIAFAGFTDGQNLNFAIPVKYLKRLNGKIGQVLPVSNVKTIPKEQKTSSTVSTNIQDGVSIRNFKPCALYSSTGVIEIEFSIKNNLPQAVKEVRILFLLYDNAGVVVDYTEGTFIFGSDIAPFLAKTVHCGASYMEDKPPSLAYKTGYKIKARVLDFEIIEE